MSSVEKLGVTILLFSITAVHGLFNTLMLRSSKFFFEFRTS